MTLADPAVGYFDLKSLARYSSCSYAGFGIALWTRYIRYLIIEWKGKS